MSNKHLSRRPKKIDADSWWYEEAGGISIVVVVNEVTRIKKIPWKQIRGALKRKDKKWKS